MAFMPVLVLLLSASIRPFRWDRLLWTYLIPVIPICVSFDGLVSCLRTYSVKELQALTRDMDADGYRWQIGRLPFGALKPPVTYLLGIPGSAGGGA